MCVCVVFEVEQLVREVRSGEGSVNRTEDESVIASQSEVDRKAKAIWRIRWCLVDASGRRGQRGDEGG